MESIFYQKNILQYIQEGPTHYTRKVQKRPKPRRSFYSKSPCVTPIKYETLLLQSSYGVLVNL